MAVHSETKVGGISLGLSRSENPKPEELKKELTNMKNAEPSKNDMNNNRSSATNTGNLSIWKLPHWLIAVLMVPLV